MTQPRLAPILLALCTVFLGGCSETPPHEQWFYVVKTKSTDPAREDAFNAWYDDIDIPDVLEVPSFKRARRAAAQRVADHPDVYPAPSEGNYVALYDIETSDIDNAIIDLYVAARRMTARGRITDLLKVTEANYYRTLDRPAAAPPAEQAPYLYVQKVLCCTNADDRDAFVGWYQDVLRPDFASWPGGQGLSLHELYRIMETEAITPAEIPHFLIVYEIAAASAEEAYGVGDEAFGRLRSADALAAQFVEAPDSALYLQRSDVRQ